MNTDNLDQLSDAALSEAFAVEYLGWFRGRSCDGRDVIWPSDCASPKMRKKWPYGISCGPIATSSDSMIAHLDKQWVWYASKREDGKHVCTVLLDRDNAITAVSTTLPRAACIALLMVDRSTKKAAERVHVDQGTHPEDAYAKRAEKGQP